MRITNLTEPITIHQDGYFVIITPTDPVKAENVAGFKTLMEVKFLSTNKNIQIVGEELVARLKIQNGGK